MRRIFNTTKISFFLHFSSLSRRNDILSNSGIETDKGHIFNEK